MRARVVIAAAALLSACSGSSGGVRRDPHAGVDGVDGGPESGAASGGAGGLLDAARPEAGAGGSVAAGGAGGQTGTSDATSSGGTSADAGDGGPLGTCAAPFAALSGTFDTTSASTELTPSCASQQGAGPGLVYRFVSGSPGRFEVQIASSSDLSLSLFNRCGASELDCSDGLGGDEQLAAPAEAGVPLLFVVSGHSPGDMGSFTLHTSFKAARCGDGALDGGETCDDGNVKAGDGCSATCTLEACDAPGDLTLAVKVDGAVSGPSLVTNPCANRLSGPEAVHRFTAPAAGVYRFTLIPDAGVDLVLSLAGTCPLQDEEQCVDAAFAGGPETAVVTLAAGQTEYVVVEGWGVPDVGPY